MDGDLKKIKKYYGEDMMHLCRNLFPTILEEEGTLLRLLEDSFPHNRELCIDIIMGNKVEAFRTFINDKFYDHITKEKKNKIVKSPFELMDEAGYTLYECHSEADIQKFKKYYARNEALCTFGVGRLKDYMVFFAVKKNADEIKREDYPNPKRQDEYGTSVISIQYLRGDKNTLSIKNRYNHTVDNPDATFSNNLDNIIDGLNDSFEETYKLSHTGSYDKFELNNYVRANDGKFYKYNYVIDDVYYCTNNIIIDNYNVVDKYMAREKYILMDYFIVDMVNKKIFTYDGSDKYIEGLNDISKIEVVREQNECRFVTLIMNNQRKVIFEIDKYNRIIMIKDNYTREIPDNALQNTRNIHKLSMLEVMKCGDNFLLGNSELQEIDMPEIRLIGDGFLTYNRFLEEIYFPKLQVIGNMFMRRNDILKEISLPNVIYIGDEFLGLNRSIERVKLPSVKVVGDWFLSSDMKLMEFVMPKLETAHSNFLSNCGDLKIVDLPNLKSVGNYCLHKCEARIVKLPKLISVGDRFMQYNGHVTNIDLPSIKNIGSYFMSDNRIIKTINMPNLETVDDYFLLWNNTVEIINLPSLTTCGADFLAYNVKIKTVN